MVRLRLPTVIFRAVRSSISQKKSTHVRDEGALMWSAGLTVRPEFSVLFHIRKKRDVSSTLDRTSDLPLLFGREPSCSAREYLAALSEEAL